jgi:hypothetical protein
MDDLQDVVPESWAELQDALYAESWRGELGRHRPPFAFRGQSRVSEPLTTSLERLGGPYGDLERHLLRNFHKYARRDAVSPYSFWDWLALAKHHGVPTRVLDWTFSPLVALHFATAHPEQFHEDGAVWCIDHVRAAEELPNRLRRLLEEEGSNVFTADLLGQAAATLDALDRLSDKPFVIFFEPPSLDQRIVNQYALFSLMSSPTARLGEWLAERPGLCQRVVVPSTLKWEVRDKLDAANVTERVLFPGLDGLGRWLARYYAPRESG